MADYAFQFTGVPFDVLDAATFEALSAFGTLLTFEINQPRPAIVEYTLTSRGLAIGGPGDLGRIRLTERKDGIWVHCYNPPRPTERLWAEAEKLCAAAIENQEGRYAKVNEIQAKVRVEADSAHESRSELHREIVRGLISRLSAQFPKRSRQPGPTMDTVERGKLYKKLKDAHPDWSYATVAIKASREDGGKHSDDTVRNTYRALKWKWDRAERIR